MTTSPAEGPFRCWVPSSASAGVDHALAQWLESIGLFVQLSPYPPLEPGHPLLVAILLGSADSWQQRSLALRHVDLGGPSVLDADALVSSPVAESIGLETVPGLSHDDGPVGHVRNGQVPAAVWSPVLWSQGEEDSDPIAVLDLAEKGETLAVLMAGPASGPVAALAFPVARIAAWLLGCTGSATELGVAPMDSSPYDSPPAYCSSPVLDVYGGILWQALVLLATARGEMIVRKRPLPRGIGPVVCLSHDIDGLRSNVRALVRHAQRALGQGKVVPAVAAAALAACTGTAKLLARAGAIGRYQPHRFTPRALARMARSVGVDDTYLPELTYLLEVEQRHGVRSTLFFLDNKSSANSDYSFHDELFEHAVEIGVKAGCDFGLHGTLDSAGDADILQSEASDFRSAVSSTVTSVRQHHLLSLPEIRRSQRAAGFEADSSLGYNHGTAFRAGTARPFQLFDHDQGTPLDLWELPLIAMDSALASDPGDASAAETKLHHLIEVLAETQGVLTINWHPNFGAAMGSGAEHGLLYERLLEEVVARRGAELWNQSEFCRWWRARAETRLETATVTETRFEAVLTCRESIRGLTLEFAGRPSGRQLGSLRRGHPVVAHLEPGANTIGADLAEAPIP